MLSVAQSLSLLYSVSESVLVSFPFVESIRFHGSWKPLASLRKLCCDRGATEVLSSASRDGPVGRLHPPRPHTASLSAVAVNSRFVVTGSKMKPFTFMT